MDQNFKDWVDVIAKIAAGAGVLIAALNYVRYAGIKRAEWLRSLFEKFYENDLYKEVRVWLDYGELNQKLNSNSAFDKRSNEEKFTDFLNFFEFIGVLYSRKELTLHQINDIFDYYLKKIKNDPDCNTWVDKYGFEKLRILLNKI